MPRRQPGRPTGWQASVRQIAEALGALEAVREPIARVGARIDALRAALGERAGAPGTPRSSSTARSTTCSSCPAATRSTWGRWPRCAPISSWEFYEDLYDKLSRIAPTILLDRSSGPSALLEPVAAAVADPQALDDLNTRLQRRKAEVAAGLPDDLEIPLAFISSAVDFFGSYVPSSTGAATIAGLLRELGVRAPDQQRAAAGEANPDGFFEVSEERLDLLDGQHLMLFAGGSSGSAGPVREALAGDPLWNSLDAVRGRRVRLVGSHWGSGEGPLAQLAVLDDLEAWFGSCSSSV